VRRAESNFDILEIVKKFLSETMELETVNGSIDCVTRLGKGSCKQPVLVRLTSFLMKLEMLMKTITLISWKSRVGKDFAWERRKIRTN
jgi:hypothetical protein